MPKAQTKSTKKDAAPKTEAAPEKEAPKVEVESHAVADGVSAPSVMMTASLWKALAGRDEVVGIAMPLGVKIVGRHVPELVSDVIDHTDEANGSKLAKVLWDLVCDVQTNPDQFKGVRLRTPAKPRAIRDGVPTWKELDRVLRAKLVPKFRCDGLLWEAAHGGGMTLLEMIRAPKPPTFGLAYAGYDEADEADEEAEVKKVLVIEYAWTGRMLKPVKFTVSDPGPDIEIPRDEPATE